MVNPWTSQQIETSGGGSLVTRAGDASDNRYIRPIPKLSQIFSFDEPRSRDMMNFALFAVS
jgi:hypothetical protein